MQQILVDLKGETNSNTIIVGNSNTPLTSRDRSSRQKINKETIALSDTLDHKNLIDIFRAFHPQRSRIYIFLSAHETFSRIDYILGHKTSPNKFKKIEIISSIISNHNDLKLENNYKKN